MARPSNDLRALGRVVHEFGADLAERKLELVRRLGAARLSSAKQVLAFHEALIFLRAYPDDERVLALCEQLLQRFEGRPDLRRFRADLADSGIAGTEIAYRFYAPTASWLVKRFGSALRVDWDEFDHAELLARNLWMLVLWGESSGLDEKSSNPEEQVRRLKGPKESDAEFLIRRIEALPMHVFARERFAEELDLPLRLLPGRGTPSRTRARFAMGAPEFQRNALRRERPELAREVRRAPRAVREVSLREGRMLVQLAREAMVTRSRDLEAFMHADERDVRMVDCGDGLQFAVMGVRPERRLLLESVYGFLTLRNGVPIGYVLVSTLFRSAEVAYNVFEAYRGAEAAHVYGRALATARALFDVDTFMVPPYQLGHENDEGLRSGAWWFYQKLGFRPRAIDARRLMNSELARIRRNRMHRSSVATLERLAAHELYFELGRTRDDVLGKFPLERVGAAITRYAARRFGADRERAVAVCADELAALVGQRAWRRLPSGERIAFERFAPLVAAMPEVCRWSAGDRRALGAIVRAKGGRRESDGIRLLDRHARLRTALRRLVGSR